MITFGLSYGLYKGIIDNYLAEIVSMTSFDKGVSEFFRELPGLMLVFILAAFYMFSAEKIYKIGSLIMMIGMAMQAVVPTTRMMVTLAIFVYSLGDHIQLGMRNTLSLQYAKDGNGGAALGLQNAVYQIGTLAGYLIIIAVFFFLNASTELYRSVFAVSAGIIGLGSLAALKLKGSSETDDTKRRFYFRKKYTKYYMLEVFYGARKQIFFTFGPYVLVLFYGANAMVISILFAASSVFTFFAAPLVGRIIDRFGYKNEMTVVRKAVVGEEESILSFYEQLIELLCDAEFRPIWEKGVYPTLTDIRSAVENSTMYVAVDDDGSIYRWRGNLQPHAGNRI